jgi:tRNA modification GTPase
MIENAGIEKSLMKMRQADLVLYLFDVNELNEADLKEVGTEFESKRFNYILVGNKAEELIADERCSFVSGIVFISASNGLHLDILKQRMVENILRESVPSENVIVTNARHYHALAEVYQSLIDVSTGLQAQISGDLLSLDIRRCLQYLGEITGEITNEDQLDYIFSKFCIGK